jgi:hypothetical protein
VLEEHRERRGREHGERHGDGDHPGDDAAQARVDGSEQSRPIAARLEAREPRVEDRRHGRDEDGEHQRDDAIGVSERRELARFQERDEEAIDRAVHARRGDGRHGGESEPGHAAHVRVGEVQARAQGHAAAGEPDGQRSEHGQARGQRAQDETPEASASPGGSPRPAG